VAWPTRPYGTRGASLTQSERLLERAVSGPSLTSAEEQGVRGEIERTRGMIARAETMLMLRRQRLRPM
jgi:hypothetical protein